MNKPRARRLFFCFALFLSIVLSGCLLHEYGERRAFIESAPLTSEMRMFQRMDGTTYHALELLATPVKRPDAGTLYNLRWYPRAKTVSLTVRPRTRRGNPVFYLTGADGVQYAGWYVPDETRYGIYKVFFEELGCDSFESLAFYANGDRRGDPLGRFELSL